MTLSKKHLGTNTWAPGRNWCVEGETWPTGAKLEERGVLAGTGELSFKSHAVTYPECLGLLLKNILLLFLDPNPWLTPVLRIKGDALRAVSPEMAAPCSICPTPIWHSDRSGPVDHRCERISHRLGTDRLLLNKVPLKKTPGP